MADLLVHFATGFAGGRLLRDGRSRAILYMGVCFPDFLYKALLYVAGSTTWVCEPSHTQLGLAVFCYAAALLFEEPWRKRAFGLLLAGSYLHLLIDLGKNYQGMGVILWAFPFSMDAVELGWYYPEETLYFMAPALLLAGLIELASRIRSRSR